METASDDRRITFFTGHYGSGKTEISINYALNIKNCYDRLTLVDLDFVNPYFRSREARELLAGEGIAVVGSAEEYYNTDLPAFSPQIIGVFQNKAVRVIADLGGDEIGARAAGRFRNHIKDDEYELFFVLNPFRPFTSELSEVKKLMEKIENSSRLKVSALISNPNLVRETNIEDILTGHGKVMEASAYLGLPVKMLALEEKFYGLPEIEAIEVPLLKLTRVMLTPWET